MTTATIAAISDRIGAQIPSEPDEITQALIAARDDVRTLLEENARLREGPAHSNPLRAGDLTPVVKTVKNFGSTGAIIGSLFDEIAALKGRVSALEAHAVLDLIPEEVRA